MIISNEIYNFYVKYSRYIIIAAGLVGLAGIVGFGYYWYRLQSEYRAQRDFAETGEDFYKFLSGATGAAAWKDMEQAIGFRAQQHRNSVLYPYFLAYKADALIQQGNNQEAINLLDQALNKLDKSSDFYYLYAIKRALLKLDFDKEEVRTEGLKELENLSQDKNNPFYDMAAYYRGFFAWNNKDREQAKKFWNQISKLANQSVWGQLAQVRLQGLS